MGRTASAIRLLSILLLALAASGCAASPLKVGFTAELSGKYSEAGVNLRNGVQMAVDELNAQGGIGGHKIELVIQDDLGTPEGAQTAEEKLLAAGVVAVVGHYTSGQTLAGYQVTEPKNMVLISGTASTSELSGKADHFFRTVVSTDAMGREFARYIYQQRGISQVSVVLDQDNAAYTIPLFEAFSQTFSVLGGTLTRTAFSESAQPDFTTLGDTLLADQPAAILIIASPTSTAMIAQVVRMQGSNIPLFSSSWGQGASLIANGGKAVEGMEILLGIDVNDPSPALQDFEQRYQQLYAHPPIFTALEGYETMRMLAEALKKTDGKAAGLPEALSGLKNFQGLSGSIRMDAYGDANRPMIIQKISSGTFQTILKISASD